MTLTQQRHEAAEQAVAIVEDLNEVARAAGRFPYTLSQLKNMSLFDFLIQDAAPNGIRFVYVPEER